MLAMEYKFVVLSVLLLGSLTVHGESGLSEEDKKVLLHAHNYSRSLAAEVAANEENGECTTYSTYTSLIELKQ
jgi:uncharacterized protein (UPF0333 family)